MSVMKFTLATLLIVDSVRFKMSEIDAMLND